MANNDTMSEVRAVRIASLRFLHSFLSLKTFTTYIVSSRPSFSVKDSAETARLKRIGELWYKSAHPLKASGRSDKDIEILHKKVDE
ncbi:9866_t:CDS:2, partial [Acaulospora colombiana]